jgi:hypothetical protein
LLLLWREHVLAPSRLPSRRTLRGSVCSH